MAAWFQLTVLGVEPRHKGNLALLCQETITTGLRAFIRFDLDRNPVARRLWRDSGAAFAK